MRLSQFLQTHADDILREWDAFAATVSHEGKELDKKALRDHAAEILQAIAADLEQPQTPAEQTAKSKGLGDRAAGASAAETHADFRMMAGFAIDAMITEYRALRASVLKLWTRAGAGTEPRDMEDLTRFNESIDQSIAESVGRYTRQTKKSTDLFIGILGHDIRNPLGTIMMAAEVLTRTGQLTAQAAAPIVNSAVRINSIIEQVVDFTRAQAEGVMPIVRTPGNLADQLFKVVQETQIRHPTRLLQLRSVGHFEGTWDEGRVGQLLSNLLGNAFLYGSKDGTVTVDLSSSAKEVSFSVHNEGQPIPPEDLKRIFEPMARGSMNDTGGELREPKGLGLGLYICREIVLSHGGKLDVESTAEDGTTFRVTLPRFAEPTGV
ncbi:MAG: ATP-binding protein [Ramlibacter sp.]